MGIGCTFFFFCFFSQTFHLLSNVYSGCPKLPINNLKYIHQRLFFKQVIHFKNALKHQNWFPPPACPVHQKIINYMPIFSHRSKKHHWGLMELTPFLHFQLCARSVTPDRVSSLQEHLHPHSKGKITVSLELYPSMAPHIRINVTYGQAFREDQL